LIISEIRQIFFDKDIKAQGSGFSFAQSPQLLEYDDKNRVYFTTRMKDGDKSYISHVSFVDFNRDFSKILSINKKIVIDQGELGTFDSHGIFPFSPLRTEREILGFTTGWSRRVAVDVETGIGLVKSKDDGNTFARIGPGPIVTSALNEPFLVADAFVKRFNNNYHMWYIFGTKWFNNERTNIPERIYKIGHAISDDCINWERDSRQIIPDVLGVQECQALPSVSYHDNFYHMAFCYRSSEGFRDTPSLGYKIGYAKSKDLITWERHSDIIFQPNQAATWCSDMQCYPNLFLNKDEGRLNLLLNGNKFGKEGFGLAKFPRN
jgi:hypothetical protein